MLWKLDAGDLTILSMEFRGISYGRYMKGKVQILRVWHIWGHIWGPTWPNWSSLNTKLNSSLFASEICLLDAVILEYEACYQWAGWSTIAPIILHLELKLTKANLKSLILKYFASTPFLDPVPVLYHVVFTHAIPLSHKSPWPPLFHAPPDLPRLQATTFQLSHLPKNTSRLST